MNIPIFLAATNCPGNILPDLFANLRANCTGDVTIDSLADIMTLVTNTVAILLSVAGLIAAGFIIWGGVQYMLSTGDPGKIKKAKETIVNAVVGLVITAVSFAVVTFITGRF